MVDSFSVDGYAPSLGSAGEPGQFIVVMARIAALYLQRPQQVMDEREPKPHGREEPDDWDVGHEREERAQEIQRATPLGEDAAHFIAVGVLGKRVVAKQALVPPAEDRDRDKRP